MADAVVVDEEGPKIRPELMEKERMYHCIYKGSALLFFMDRQDSLNCYEVDDPKLVAMIQECGDVEEALAKCGADLSVRK